jgi:hypothetical protein
METLASVNKGPDGEIYVLAWVMRMKDNVYGVNRMLILSQLFILTDLQIAWFTCVAAQ